MFTYVSALPVDLRPGGSFQVGLRCNCQLKRTVCNNLHDRTSSSLMFTYVNALPVDLSLGDSFKLSGLQIQLSAEADSL